MSELTATLAAEEHKILACVHCGLCLEACPTYTLTGDENDSPRGRIYLMRAVEEGKLAGNSVTFQTHIDRCLGCRACEPVCPAGVEYGQLLEASRATLFEPDVPRGISYRLLRLALRHVWLHPARLRIAFSSARVARDSGLAKLLRMSVGILSSRLRFGLALLESSGSQLKTNGRKVPAPAGRRATYTREKTELFTGCVTAGLFARVNEATKRVLQVNGFAVRIPPAQVCCGALHAHAGDLEGARVLARRNIEAFIASGGATITTNAGGCGAMLVSYDHLLAEDKDYAMRALEFSKRVRDISQQLEDNEIKQGARLTDAPVTYDASCHLLNGQHAAEAPLKLLRAIPNLNFVPLDGAERCCGGAGVYNLLEQEMSAGVLEEKLCHVRESGAAVLATGNAGCQMQIGAGARLQGMQLEVCHPIELLDESYRRAGMYE